MTLPLLGLDALLEDDGCERIELRGPGSSRAFVREGAELWAPADGSSDAVHTAGLRDTIRRELGDACDQLVCVLAEEQVAYVVEGGAVRVERTPRAAVETGPGAADLGPVTEALGIPRSRRKHKLEQARRFAGIVERALADAGLSDRAELRVLDLACGRSYLGFVLVQLLGAGGANVRLRGVDTRRAAVEKSRRIAEELGWRRAEFEEADLAAFTVEPGAADLVVSLHGCDTLTDEAIRVAVEAEAPLLFVAPCCQHELRHQLGSHPLDWVARFGLLEQRLADVLTDAFRCLVLQAQGYRVNVLRFVEPDVTPKNLLIQARRTSGRRADRAREAAAFLKQFDIRPRLAALLDGGAA
jgi:SAM-dependent methyltransferase